MTTVHGVDLHVEVDGSGPALALLNGAYCTVRQWDLVVGTLAEHFTVIRHDVRGTGRSGPGPEGEYTFERYAADLVALLDDAGASSASLWGTAWGSRVALVAAALHPDRFDRVVLGDLGIDPADVEAQKQGAAEAKAARARAGIAPLAKPDGWNAHDDIEEAGRALSATLRHPDLFPFVRGVKPPTLIMTGEYDPNLPSSRRALEGLGQGRLEVLPLAGHAAVLQRPELAAEVALSFLRQ